MIFFILVLLCIIQGITEFLPISSSGHLYLIEQLFGINGNLLLFNLFMHLASLCAILIMYRKSVVKIIKKPFQPLTYKLVLSTIVTVLLASLYKFLNFENYIYKLYGFCFLFTGVLLIIVDCFQKKACVVRKEGVTFLDSFLVGISQGIAVLPGISRSGATVSTLLFLGCDDEKATEYSFLLSVPVIIGGFILEIFGSGGNYSFGDYNLIELVFAFILTFFISFFSLKLFLKILKKKKLFLFGVYLLIVAIFVVFLNY